MATTVTSRNAKLSLKGWTILVVLSVVMLCAGAGFAYLTLPLLSEPSAPPPAEGGTPRVESKQAVEAKTVHFARSRWESAGIHPQSADRKVFFERVWRSARLGVNESRVAHLSPMIEGIVREVPVRLGQHVKVGEVLAVLDCREVGQTKLDLVKARLDLDYAKAEDQWTRTVNKNATDMVRLMVKNLPIGEVEKKFKGTPIGDLRQQLMSAYSRRTQTKSQYESANKAYLQGAMPEATVISLKANYDSAEATYRAVCEEVGFQAIQRVRASGRKLQEASTNLAMTKARLMMLGFSRNNIDTMDPLEEGREVSMYSLRAPFAGTVLDQHAVPAERVGPDIQMFRIVDLSTLWLKVDIFENDIALAQNLSGKKVHFQINGKHEKTHEAEVFYSGDVVDRDTRASTLLATVSNREGLLKPGMFVEVELMRAAGEAVQVPEEAIQRQGTQTFVFIQSGDEEFQRQDVKLGRSSAGVVEVLEGIEPGQRVVVRGGFVLKSELMRDLIAGD